MTEPEMVGARGITDTDGARICIGMPVYNGGVYLAQALDSILSQTYADFRIIIVDDCSTDDSPSILRRYAQQDGRIALYQNPIRTGLVSAWRKVAELAAEIAKPDYFAWFSDHDWVERDWLKKLLAAFQGDGRVVLAHASTQRVSVAGSEICTGEHTPPIDTCTLDSYEALDAVTIKYFGGAGDAIYGLFRFDVLKRCGIFPFEVFPDILIVSGCCLHGAIKHVPAAIRFRREFTIRNFDETLENQMHTLFANGHNVPAEPLLSNATYFVRGLLESPTDGDADMVLRRTYHALAYMTRIAGKLRNKHDLAGHVAVASVPGLREFTAAITSMYQRSSASQGKALAACRSALAMAMSENQHFCEAVVRPSVSPDNIHREMISDVVVQSAKEASAMSSPIRLDGSMPLVTIGLPVFNGAETLPESLATLCAQDYPNIQIIISDNASTDQTLAICEEFAFRHQHIRIIRKQCNEGAVENFRTVLNAAKGEFFMWAAADDYWSPHFVSSLLPMLQGDQTAGVAMCAVERRLPGGEPFDLIRFSGKRDPSEMGWKRLLTYILSGIKYNLFIYGLFRTAVLKRAMTCFPDVLGGDRQFICQLALATRFVYLDKILLTRTHQVKNAAVYVATMSKTGTLRSQLRAFVRMILLSDVIPWSRKAWLPIATVQYFLFALKQKIPLSVKGKQIKLACSYYLTNTMLAKLVLFIGALVAGAGTAWYAGLVSFETMLLFCWGTVALVGVGLMNRRWIVACQKTILANLQEKTECTRCGEGLNSSPTGEAGLKNKPLRINTENKNER